MKERRNLSNYEQALLDYLVEEMKRIYWNNYGVELTGYFTENDIEEVFKNVGIEWSPYDWDDDWNANSDSEDIVHNLTINKTKFWFYKYYGRGMYTSRVKKLDEEWFNKSLKTIRSLEKPF
jgi:hypothetical protein